MIRDSKGNRILLASLLAIAFVLLTVDARAGDSSPFGPLRGLGSAIFAPVQRTVEFLARPITGTVSALGRVGEHEAEIERLREENGELRTKLSEIQSERDVSTQLSGLLTAATRGSYRIVPARVIAMGPEQGFSRTVAVDSGSRDGIHRGMSVVTGAGLAGRVVSTGPHTATVLLIADPVSSVGVRVGDSGEVGTVTGGGGDLLRLQMFDPHAPVAKGDVLVTFGSLGGRPYVAGVPVGEVVQVNPLRGGLTRTAMVRALVDPTAVDVVGIVVETARTEVRPTLPAGTG